MLCFRLTPHAFPCSTPRTLRRWHVRQQLVWIVRHAAPVNSGQLPYVSCIAERIASDHVEIRIPARSDTPQLTLRS